MTCPVAVHGAQPLIPAPKRDYTLLDWGMRDNLQIAEAGMAFDDSGRFAVIFSLGGWTAGAKSGVQRGGEDFTAF
jgi:hypothetical protein